MANPKLSNIKGLFRNTRTRTILILTGVVLFFAVLIGIFRLSAPVPGPTGEAKMRQLPGNIQSIPGGFEKTQTPEYAKLQEQQNAEQAKLAQRRGTSAIPTIIRSGEIGGPQAIGGLACCQPCPCPPAGAPAGGLSSQASILTPGTLVCDAQGRVIGTVGPDGKVRDANGNAIGAVGPDGMVRDSNNNIVGTAGVSAAGRPVFDPQGKKLGILGPDGKVRDAGGNVVGAAGCRDDSIRDSNGKVIGRSGSVLAGAPVYDSQGRLIGTVGPDGKVRDANGNVIGTVDPDGNVRDLSGNVIGRTGPGVVGATPVYDDQGRLIGTVGPDGKVRDANGRVIGTVDANGVVRDASGRVISTATRKAGAPTASRTGTPVFDNQGRLVGTLGADGKVRDANGRIVGEVGPNGFVRNAETGALVGKAGSVVPGSPVYDSQGRLIGTVGADGKVRDANGNVVGTVGADGVVRDASGNEVGRVGPTITGTPIYDAQGRLIGIAGPDGKVRDVNGKVIGTVGSNGVVQDLEGRPIGSTSPTGLAAQRPTTATITPLPGAGPSAEAQQLQAIAQRQAEMISKQQAEQVRTQIQGAMTGQANQLMAAWVSPIQQFIQGKPLEIKKVGRGGYVVGPGGTLVPAVPGGPGPEGGSPGAIVKAGSVMFGVLITAVNSDEPGPILATIVEGKFRGGRILGSLTNQGDKVMLTFNTLSLPGVPNSTAINAVAIDECTARTSLSSYTNYHYLMRYGTLFASAFIQGYGQAFQTSGQTVISTGLATATTTPNLSPRGKFFVALGNVGTRYSSVLGNIFNTPPTVHVYSGTALGILFLSDIPPIPGFAGNV